MKADKTYDPSANGCITSEAEMEYYKNNLDVLAHLMMADFHYANHGIYEGRFWPSKTIPTVS